MIHNELDLIGRIIETGDSSGSETPWIRVALESSMVKAINRLLMEEDNSGIRNIRICWDGYSETKSRNRLDDWLKADILERYLHDEYMSPDTDERDFTADILNRYHNYEYWDPDIVQTFVAESNTFSAEDMDIIRKYMTDTDILETVMERNGGIYV